MSDQQDIDAGHVAVVMTIQTSTGQVTLIVNDDSHWKASALSVICERAVAEAIAALGGTRPGRDEAGAPP